MKRVREFAAAQQISAFVILRPDGRLIAKVHTHFATSRMRSTVTVYNYGLDSQDAPIDPQTAHRNGYGYDKETAALSGMWIDGHIMTDHCGYWLGKPEGGWKHGTTPPIGFEFANFLDDAWQSCYRLPGFRVLIDFGYRVIKAI